MTQVQQPGMEMSVAGSDTLVRADFIRKTYLHVFGAVLALIALEAVYFTVLPIDPIAIAQIMMGTMWSWLVVLGLFMGVCWVADKWAHSDTSVGTQYFGLGLYVVAQSVILLPLLAIAQHMYGWELVSSAAIQTVVVFGGVTAFVLVSGADFTFLRGILAVGFLLALGTIVLSAIMGFTLGLIFVVAMIGLAIGMLLYQTSAVLHTYRPGQHVAASLGLFGSLAVLFWYVLHLLMILRGD